MENQTYEPKLSELLFGEIIPLEEKKATPLPGSVEPPKPLELQVEDADYLIEGVPNTRERQKSHKADIQVTADRYLFPFRNPGKVKLATYSASDPATGVMEDLIIRTNQAILEDEIQAPPTGLLRPGDLFTICDVVVQQDEKDPYIPKTPEHISFPHQIESLEEELSCKVGIWRAPTDKTEKHPEALNLIGELVRSLDPSLYSKTRIILQIREHFKGDENLGYEELSKKYFSKVTDTSRHKIKLKPEENPDFLTQEIRDVLAHTIDIKEAGIKRRALSKRRAFETLTPKGNSRRVNFDGEYRKDETVMMPPKAIHTSDTVYLSPKEKRASDTVIIPPENDDIVILPKNPNATYLPEALERAKRKLQNHYPNSNLGGGKK